MDLPDAVDQQDPLDIDIAQEVNGCLAARFAQQAIRELNLSQEAKNILQLPVPQERWKCPECGRKTATLFCPLCIKGVLPLPERIQLGLEVHILRHPREPASKSSAAGLPLLADDIHCHDLGSATITDYLGNLLSREGMWVVYPSPHAVPTSCVDWSKVSSIMLIDCRWAQANGVVRDHPALTNMPAIRLETSARSMFWRRGFAENETQGFVSTAECLRLLLRERAKALGHAEEPLDHLLLFFAQQHQIITQYYAESQSGKCCPWCVEEDRRRRIRKGTTNKAILAT